MKLDLLIIATVLFVLLSPGMVLQLPPSDGSIFFNSKTSIESVLIHAVVFYGLLFVLSKNF